jgi:hypothetical protein
MYPCRDRHTLFTNLACLDKCCERVLKPGGCGAEDCQDDDDQAGCQDDDDQAGCQDDEMAELVLNTIVSASGTDGLAPECLLPNEFGFTALSMFVMHRELPSNWKYFVALATRCPELVHHPTAYGSTPMSVVAVEVPNAAGAIDAYVRRLMDLPASDDGWRSTMRDILHWRMSYPRPEEPPWLRRDVFERGVHRLGRHDTRDLIETEFGRAVADRTNSWTSFSFVADDAAKVRDQLLALCDELCDEVS